jgi:hypothetical protein
MHKTPNNILQNIEIVTYLVRNPKFIVVSKSDAILMTMRYSSEVTTQA